MNREGGFTLLEMMVVIAVIGIIAAGVAFSVSGTGGRRLDAEAEHLRDTLQLAADQSVLDGTDMGVYLREDGYAFLKYDILTRQWQVLKDGAFRPRTLPDGFTITLELARERQVLDAGGQAKPRPVLTFLSSGERDPFLLTVTDRAHDRAVPMGSDGVSPVEFVRAGS